MGVYDISFVMLSPRSKHIIISIICSISSILSITLPIKLLSLLGGRQTPTSLPDSARARGGSINLTKKAALLIKLHGLPDFRNGWVQMNNCTMGFKLLVKAFSVIPISCGPRERIFLLCIDKKLSLYSF